GSARQDRRPDPGRPARQGRGDRARGRLPGRRERRLHHRLDALDQRRPAHVLMPKGGTDYAPPRKRSVLIAGHATSISLEPMFWRALEAAARQRGVPVNALVAEIDAERLDAER